MSVLSRAGSATSGITMSVSDLPNLPGVRRPISSSNPQLYKRYLAALPDEGRQRLLTAQGAPARANEDDYTLASYFDDQEGGSVQDLASVLSPFPSQGSAYNDISGRYSLKSQKQDRLTRSGSLPFTRPETAPAFLCNKLRAAHFSAYFIENVDGHGNDCERSRKVEISYYMDDNTLEIIEPKVADSGFLQGKLLKRHQVPKADKHQYSGMANTRRPPAGRSLISIDDFYSGAQVNIYNVVYHIISCDETTRNYLKAEFNRDFGPTLPMPNSYRPCGTGAGGIRAMRRGQMTASDGSVLSRATRGGTGTRNIQTAALAAGFFQYDRKVLRFFCIWDNRNMLYGDIQQVRLHYYLADDTMEILPVGSRNSGRDKMPKYLRKMRVPKSTLNQTGGSSTSQSLNASASLTALENVSTPTQYVHWTDLHIGCTVKLASITLQIVNADECTREFYEQNNRCLGTAIPVDDEETRSLAATTAMAASRLGSPGGGSVGGPSMEGSEDGMTQGSAQAGLGNATNAPVKSEEEVNMGCLLPIAPPKDGAKRNLFQGIILRYVAQMLDGQPGDENRQFVVQIFLEDDTLQIREPPMRNSGFSGGVFLKRTRMNVPDKCIPFSPSDVYIGQQLPILSHRFLIHDADEYTMHYMQSNDKQWVYSSLSNLLDKLKRNEIGMKRVFLTIPGLSTRSFTGDQVQTIMKKAGIPLNRQEIVTLFRALDPQKSGSVKLTKVLKFVVDNSVEV